MTNIKFLLIGTSLSLIPTLTFAQCVATQDCETLGYTETSCNGGKGVKCPFGNKWACLPTKESICKEEGFTLACNGNGQTGSGDSCNGLYKQCSCDSSYQYTCSGTGYSGGSGMACNGKYNKCICSSGYSWNGSSCTISCSSSYKYTCTGIGYAGGSGTVCGGKYTSCTCTSGYEWNGSSCKKEDKGEAIGNFYYCNGTVVGLKTDDMNFYIALRNVGTKMDWNSAFYGCLNYTFCGNINGTLPSQDQLRTIFSRKSELNTLLSTYGGTEFGKGEYWSSTLYTTGVPDRYYTVKMHNGYSEKRATNWQDTTVRAVLVDY